MQRCPPVTWPRLAACAVLGRWAQVLGYQGWKEVRVHGRALHRHLRHVLQQLQGVSVWHLAATFCCEALCPTPSSYGLRGTKLQAPRNDQPTHCPTLRPAPPGCLASPARPATPSPALSSTRRTQAAAEHASSLRHFTWALQCAHKCQPCYCPGCCHCAAVDAALFVLCSLSLFIGINGHVSPLTCFTFAVWVPLCCQAPTVFTHAACSNLIWLVFV